MTWNRMLEKIDGKILLNTTRKGTGTLEHKNPQTDMVWGFTSKVYSTNIYLDIKIDRQLGLYWFLMIIFVEKILDYCRRRSQSYERSDAGWLSIPRNSDYWYNTQCGLKKKMFCFNETTNVTVLLHQNSSQWNIIDLRPDNVHENCTKKCNQPFVHWSVSSPHNIIPCRCRITHSPHTPSIPSMHRIEKNSKLRDND